MLQRALILTLALVSVLVPAIAQAQIRTPFLVVLEFRVDNKVIPLDTAVTLADMVRSRVVQSGSKLVKLISREKVIEILSKGTKTAAQCSGQCEIDTAREVGADFVMTGKISPLGDKAVLVLDVKKAQDGVTVASTLVRAPVKQLDDRLDAAVDAVLTALAEKLSVQPVAKVVEDKASQLPFGGPKVEIGKTVETEELQETVVKFSSTPSATVFLGDRMLCKQTPCQKSVPLGKRMLTMSEEDYVTRSESVEITKKLSNVDWTLSADFATLDVTCDGNALALTLDGAAAGQCPLKNQHLRPGKHTVALDSPCHLHAEESFQIQRGEAKVLGLPVQPRIGVVTVKAKNDAGDDLTGTVLLDGKALGDVPGSFKVPVCGRKLEVRSEGLDSWSGELHVTEGEKARVEANLGAPLAKRPGRVDIGGLRLEQVKQMAVARDPAERQMAIRALAEFGKGSRPRPDVVALLQGARKDPDLNVKRSAVYALARLQDDGIARDLAEMNHDPDAEIRLQVALALGASSTRFTQADDFLAEMTKDPDQKVRIEAINGLSKRKAVVAVPGLMGMAQQPDPEIKRVVFKALLNLRDAGNAEKMRPLFRKGMEFKDSQVRATCVQALADKVTLDDIEALRQAAFDPSKDVKIAAIAALLSAQRPGVMDAIATFFGDTDMTVRESAIDALCGLDPGESAKAKRTYLKDAIDSTDMPEALKSKARACQKRL